jgi:hypothetical protein
LETAYTTEELRRETHCSDEELDKSSVTVAGLPDDLAHISRQRKSVQRERHSGMKTSYAWHTFGQQRFEKVELATGFRASFTELLSRLDRGAPPEIFKPRVTPGELVSRYTKEQFGRTGFELCSH